VTRYVLGFVLLAVSLGTFAQPSPVVRIRGNVESLEGSTLKVKTRAGESMSVQLPDNATVMGITKGSMADVASGKYIGTTTVGERDGALVALEIHIFPENMRGAGEGHRDWDLRPNSKMTNANVADVKAMGADRVMTVNYKGGEKKVLITADTVVVGYTPTDRAQLKAGAPVFINAERKPDGSLTAPRVNVGLNGQVPPM
jgi:Domain of unknown function (DUF5666)